MDLDDDTEKKQGMDEEIVRDIDQDTNIPESKAGAKDNKNALKRVKRKDDEDEEDSEDDTDKKLEKLNKRQNGSRS